ncbi:MAG: hypothetical protein J5802_09150 [Butyrivibrio sp.]|nr:hypothetical protein [Butyrivibrio sp.]
MYNDRKDAWVLPGVLIGFFAIAVIAWIITVRGSVREDADAAYDENIETEYENVKVDSKTKDEADESQDFSAIYGGWESESYYVFNKDGTYGWYKSSEDLEDNYYSGNVEVLRGLEACDNLGISPEKALGAFEFPEDVGIEDVYSIHCMPTYLISGGVDKSDTLQGGSYDLLFVVIDDKHAQGFNMNSADLYFFTKIE